MCVSMSIYKNLILLKGAKTIFISITNLKNNLRSITN